VHARQGRTGGFPAKPMALTGSQAFDTLGIVNRTPESVPRWLHFVAVVGFCALMGAGAGWSVLALTRSVNNPPDFRRETAAQPRVETPPTAVDSAALSESPGGRYALSLVEGDYEAVVDQVLWMNERLNRIRLRTGDESAVADARVELVESLGRRNVAENQLTPEGVEDKYVLAPGVMLEWLGHDEGRDDLEAPAARCDWIRVRYPSRARALRDGENIPIHNIVVGVHSDRGGQVLKAGIEGNLDIVWNSISYDWPDSEGD